MMLRFVVVIVSILLTYSNASATLKNKNDYNRISKSKISVYNSKVKPGNLLPQFMFMMGATEGGSVGVNIGGGRGVAKPFVPDDTCGDDIFEGAIMDERSPQLPYLTQDLWGCEREEEEIDVYTLETDDLSVTITPQYAGKIWSMFDKQRNKDLLYNNKAHQPANIGALKAWAAGGAEFNWSPGIIGHSAFTETTIFTSVVKTERGDMIRVYDYDRYNGTTFSVDIIISNYTLFIHPRITNPTEVDLRGYWWTCVAVEAKPSTRIFSPATHVAQTSREPIRNSPWPYFTDALENSTFSGYQNSYITDNSYLGNHQMGDMFLRIPKDNTYTPYIAHTQEDGYVLVHGHPLNGTKAWIWGESGPGRFMQDFLAAGRKRQGDYTELQVGPAPTQMQTFPVPSNSVTQWTEWFKGFDGDIDVLRGSNYQSALNLIDSWMKTPRNMITQEDVSDWDNFFNKHADTMPEEILVTGTPWGYLEERRRVSSGTSRSTLSKGLLFTLPTDTSSLAYKEVLPWLELLDTGVFSADTLQSLPLSYQTTDAWLDILQSSLHGDESNMTWLHALHIGIALAERGEIDEPIRLFTLSNKLKGNPIALRCIAVLQQSPADAYVYYKQAYESLQTYKHDDANNAISSTGVTDDVNDSTFYRLNDNLITEMSFFLQQQLWYDEMSSFMSMIHTNSPEHIELDSFLTLSIKVHMYMNDYDTAISMLSKYCFPTYAKARDDLMAMWNTAVVGRHQLLTAIPLTYVQQHQVRVKNPIPDNIGCQYASTYCSNYW